MRVREEVEIEKILKYKKELEELLKDERLVHELLKDSESRYKLLFVAGALKINLPILVKSPKK